MHWCSGWNISYKTEPREYVADLKLKIRMKMKDMMKIENRAKRGEQLSIMDRKGGKGEL